jgi:beta-phosphoglucomutase-like phosphatase (HAD superfamily)
MDRALIFDCDGVLADTELYGHLPAFNQMWEKMNVPWQWSKEQYGVKLKIGGGKERMASLFNDADFRARVNVPETEEERKALIARWHKEDGDLRRHH